MNEENFSVVENHVALTQGAGGPYMSPHTATYLQALFDEMCTLWYLDKDLHPIPAGDSELTPFFATKGTLEYWLEQLAPIADQVQNHYKPYLDNLHEQYTPLWGTPAGTVLGVHLDNTEKFIRAAAMYNVVLNELWFE